MISLLRPVGTFAIGLTIVALLSIALERWFPLLRRARDRLRRPGWRTDLTYAIATPLVGRMPRRLAIGVALVPVALAVGHGLDVRALLHGFGPLATQPRWLQGLEMLMIGGLIGLPHSVCIHSMTSSRRSDAWSRWSRSVSRR